MRMSVPYATGVSVSVLRKTEITAFENIQAEKVITLNAKLYANFADGFIGTDQKKIDGAQFISDCSDIADVVVFRKNGHYMVTKIRDKAFVGKDIIHVQVFTKGDERTVYNAIYRDGKNGGAYYAKRFSITGITRDKEYDLTMGTEGSTVMWFTANGNGEAETLKIVYKPRPKLKKLTDDYNFADLAIKGRSSRGNIVTNRNIISRITLRSKGVSTLSGKQIWFDSDINRLIDTDHGLYLGEFNDGDSILVVCSDGTFYTTSFDLANHYQGDIIRIEKLDSEKIFSVLYYDAGAKAYYIKRFPFEANSGMPQSFIGDEKGSRLIEISSDLFPQLLVTFGGRNASREEEAIDVEQFIGQKSFRARGKKVSSYEIAEVRFIEPLEKEIVPSEKEPAEENPGEDTEDTGAEVNDAGPLLGSDGEPVLF